MPAGATRFWVVMFMLLGPGLFTIRAADLGKPAPLALSPAEQAWVAAHPVIRVGYDPAWPPFSDRTADGSCVGIDADLLRLVEARTGLKFEFVPGETWGQVYDAALKRQTDMLVGTARTAEREKSFAFTGSYFSAPVVIVTRNDEPLLWSVLDLIGRRVVGTRGYAPTEELRREYPELHFVLVDTTEQALRAVADGEADAFISNLPNVSFVAKTQGLTNLKVAGVIKGTFDLCYAVRPDWPELVALLDRANAALTEAERQAILHTWIRVDYAKVIRWDLVWKTAVSVLSGLAVVIGAIVYHNRRLARELKERIRLQLEIKEAHDQLVLLNEEKTELLQMAAHDLRGPLTGMQLVVDSALRLSAVPQETALAMIEKQIRQMTGLLNDLLDVDALEHGRREFHFELADPATVLRASLAGAASLAAQKSIVLDARRVGEALPKVRADLVALRQITDNLLSNAIKFSPRGSTVSVLLEQRDKLIRLEVRDQGPGVAAEEAERIFAKYARGQARPTAGEKSTGLGLSIVRQLATAMNGRVWCEARRADVPGGLFIVLLPVAAPEAVV